VLSGRQGDLERALRRWMQISGTDKSLCMHFEAYSSSESYDASQNPTKYSDAELEAIPDGLQYTNNPNSGYEGWTSPEGKEHILHAAQ
jgi:hypothetical protein